MHRVVAFEYAEGPTVAAEDVHRVGLGIPSIVPIALDLLPVGPAGHVSACRLGVDGESSCGVRFPHSIDVSAKMRWESIGLLRQKDCRRDNSKWIPVGIRNAQFAPLMRGVAPLSLEFAAYLLNGISRYPRYRLRATRLSLEFKGKWKTCTAR